MNEIEKLYENAGFIQKRCKDYSCIVCDKNKDCDKYPPFTAEKQLGLIKFLIKDYNYYLDVIDTNNFENSLAASLNDLWQDLTEQEKEQRRGILE